MYHTLLLDVDGTLLNFRKSQDRALEKAFSVFGYSPTEELKNLYDTINHSYWRRYEKREISREELLHGRFETLFQETGIRENPRAFEEAYQTFLGEGAYPLDGAMDLVQYLYKKYDLYIVTNGVARTQRSRLERSGLDQYMKDIFISEELGCQKPVREYFDLCMERIGNGNPVDRTGFLIIGDGLSSDILGGNNAGIDTCWYNPGRLLSDPEIPAKFEVHSFDELRELL